MSTFPSVAQHTQLNLDETTARKKHELKTQFFVSVQQGCTCDVHAGAQSVELSPMKQLTETKHNRFTLQEDMDR